MRYIIKISCLLMYLCLWLPVLQSQQVDPGTLLSAALYDPALQILDRSHAEISSIKYTLPILEKIELNVNERIFLSRQSFQLRTSFNGLGLRKAEHEKFSALLNFKASQNKTLRHSVLLQRYFDIAEWLHLNYKLTISRSFLTYYTDMERTIETLLSNGISVDLTEYVKVKENIMEEKTRIDYLYDLKGSMLRKMRIDTSLTVDDTRIILPEPARTKLEELIPDFDTHALLTDIDSEYSYLKASLEREKAESKKIIDYAQLRYILRDNLDRQNGLAFGFGLLFPWKGSKVLKQYDINVKQNSLQAEKEIKQLNLKADFEAAKNDYINAYKQYTRLISYKNDPNILKIKNQLLQSGRVDPLKALQIRGSELETESKLAEIKFKLLNCYIQALHSSGELYSQPYRNFLHPLFPILDMK